MRRFTLGVASALALAIVFASPAHAYRIYNKTGENLRFSGEKCARCYTGIIDSGDSAACPGGEKGCGGTTYISMHPAGGEDCKNDSGMNPVPTVLYCPIPVAAHGWIEFYPGTTCVVFAEDGTVQSAVVNGTSVGGVDAKGQPIPIRLVEHCGIYKK